MISRNESSDLPAPMRTTPDAINAGRDLTAEQLDELWAAYLADRGNLRLRNRLVEHYLPWVGDLAASLAKKMRLRDRENAVGEALAALVESIVPDYDGKSGFHRWAYACTKRKLLDLRRAERRVYRHLRQPAPGAAGQRARQGADRGHSGGRADVGQITADLNDRQAAVLWLRGYCGLSVEAVAPVLKLSPRSVEAWTHRPWRRYRKIPRRTALRGSSVVINL